MNRDQPLIKWWMWIQNIDVDQKPWNLTVDWSMLSFYPIQLIFTHLSNWLSKLVKQGLKPDMRILWSIWGTMKPTWSIRSSISFEKNKTLVVGESLRRRTCLINPWEVLSIWNSYEHEGVSWINLSWKWEGKF